MCRLSRTRLVTRSVDRKAAIRVSTGTRRGRSVSIVVTFEDAERRIVSLFRFAELMKRVTRLFHRCLSSYSVMLFHIVDDILLPHSVVMQCAHEREREKNENRFSYY